MLKSMLIGLGVYLVGFILVGLTGSIYNGSSQYSSLRAITYSILYLAAVIAVCTSLIVKKTNKN